MTQLLKSDTDALKSTSCTASSFSNVSIFCFSLIHLIVNNMSLGLGLVGKNTMSPWAPEKF